MKKVLSLAGIVMMLSVVLCTSCRPNTSFDSSIDTVINLNTPVVNAKNYPGVNYVYWNSVPNADKYYFSKYEDNVLISTTTYSSTSLRYIDTDIKNDVSYTYKVQAIGNLSTSRSVVTSDSEEGSCTVKGILPPASTSPLNLAAYEGGYNGDVKTLSGDENGKYLLKPENISVTEDNGKIVISFPAKAYLTYTVYSANGNFYDKTGAYETATSVNTNYSNNQRLSVAINKSYSGTYRFAIRAIARHSSYYPTYDTVDVAETVTIDTLNVGYGSALTCSYIDNGSTVRVKWVPTSLPNGEIAYLNYYKVYRSVINEGNYTEVEATIKKDEVTSYYYIDDNTVDSSKSYTYLVVITDGDKYGTNYGLTSVAVYSSTGSVSTPSASYIDNGHTVRVSFSTTKLTDGTVAKPANYAVYRKASILNADAELLTGDLKYTDASLASMYIDDTVADNTIPYYYYVVLTDKNSKRYSSYTTLAAFTKTAVAKPQVTAAAEVKHSNGLKDDITWTITLEDSDTTCRAYLFKTDLKNTKTPVYGDFDLSAPLEITSATAVDQKTYKVYTDEVGLGKVYMLVVASKEDYADSYTISNPVEVKAPSMSQPTLSVSVYDDTITAATPASYVPVDNDVIINVTDTLSATTEDITNYTYTLYCALSYVASDSASITWTIDNEWIKVGAVTMKSNETYNPEDTTVTFVGVVELKNVADGLYGYKLVKTDTYGNSKVSSISYVNIAATPVVSIAYKPTLSVTWGTGSLAEDYAVITFTKNTIDSPVEEEHASVTHVTGMTDETAEAGVTYRLYRSTLVDEGNKTSVVFTLVGTVTTTENNTASYTKYTWDETGAAWDAGTTAEYVESLTYKYVDMDLSTGNTYQYILVSSKAGAEDVISSSVTLAGAN